ncbi:TraR/DksA family transcriptional regulator [Rhizomonospora bruguierae]|uniref:TraR/DksA family transcriptional regulator n=1 Tax=Rhizomonospora bruguierae TaxID=1581705 RepID=UPI001BCEA775|nr:TraR/DksA C4-type zinc finger protein [Micromonospora sp. NBRC 107566]
MLDNTTAVPTAAGATVARTPTQPHPVRPVHPAGTGRARSAADTDRIRQLLLGRHEELRGEYERALADHQLVRSQHQLDAAGDDEADTGAKTAEQAWELSLLRSIAERRGQVELALQRLDDGGYGMCEGCGEPIPVERLEVFPSATSCVACKQVGERRAA